MTACFFRPTGPDRRRGVTPGRRVLSAGAETTSGTYFLIAAAGHGLERIHWNGLGLQTEPYDIGGPVAGEPADGLDDFDGQRLTGVLRAAGSDVDVGRDGGSKVVVEATYGGDPVPGPAGAALEDWRPTQFPAASRSSSSVRTAALTLPRQAVRCPMARASALPSGSPAPSAASSGRG